MPWAAVVPGFSVLSVSRYPHTTMSLMPVIPQWEDKVAAGWLLGDLSMKDLTEWHVFIKAFSVHFRNSERIVLPGMRRRDMSVAVLLPCRNNCCGCPCRSAALAHPVPAPQPMDEGESCSVLMQLFLQELMVSLACRSLHLPSLRGFYIFCVVRCV